MKSGNLNFLEPSGPLQACNGIALLIKWAQPYDEIEWESVNRINFAEERDHGRKTWGSI